MFIHNHPYAPFIPKNTTKLIVGTIPPPRFSKGELFDGDVDFCYGSKYGLLWPILDRIYNLGLTFQNTEKAIKERQSFLINNGIGICDMIDSCQRQKIDASDTGMQAIRLRNILAYITKNEQIETLLFMGGNSKNGPENLFRKHVKSLDIKLKPVSLDQPKIHQFTLGSRKIRTVSLISPSSSANRSIGGADYYKHQKKKNPKYSTMDFRIEQYRLFFC